MNTYFRYGLYILLVSLFVKACYVLFAVLIDSSSISGEYGFIEVFKRNDTHWYKKIHENGYDIIATEKDLGWHDGAEFHQSNWGFMPGYPMLTKLTAAVLGTGFEVSAFALSIILSSLCFLLFYWLACLWSNNPRAAFFSTLLFILLPFQYYYSMMYAEALFGSLLLASFISIHYKKYWITAITASYLVITRAGGITLLLPLGIYLLEQEGILGIHKFRPGKMNAALFKKLLLFLFPVLSMAGYCYFQYVKTGDLFAYSTAQQNGWYRELMFPLSGLFRRSYFTAQFNSWYAIVIMLTGILVWKKLPLSYNLVIWLSILLPLSAGSADGMTRYVTLIFPLFFLLGDWFCKLKRKPLLLSLFFSLQLLTFYFWLVGSRFSF